MLGGVCPRIFYYETRTTKWLGAENEISLAGLGVLYHGREREEMFMFRATSRYFA